MHEENSKTDSRYLVLLKFFSDLTLASASAATTTAVSAAAAAATAFFLRRRRQRANFVCFALGDAAVRFGRTPATVGRRQSHGHSGMLF